MKENNNGDFKKESKKGTFSQYLDEWMRTSNSTKQLELKKKEEVKKEREKKKEVGPAKLDVTQWLGDTVKSLVSLHPKRGKMEPGNLEDHQMMVFESLATFNKSIHFPPVVDHFVFCSLNPDHYGSFHSKIEYQCPPEAKTPLELPNFLKYCFPTIINPNNQINKQPSGKIS